jgi:hypothetical protein
MKLGVSYIVFDGVELLEHSIKQIRRHVDFLQVIYQDQSWFGRSISPESVLELEKLKRKGLIDSLIKFTQFIPVQPGAAFRSKTYERAKRQMGLQSCLTAGCTHYLCMDVDEFYIEEEFKSAKEIISVKGYTSTAVKFINYVNYPTLHRGYDSSSVPFICKIDLNSKMDSKFFIKCDPTRGIIPVGESTHQFKGSEISMHHMETVRKDLRLKYESTTRALFIRSKTNELVSNIKSVREDTEVFGFNKIIYPKSSKVRLKKVDNIFNIPYERWK